MLLRHRRFFAVFSLLRFATPLIWDFVLPDSPDLISKDGRRFAPPPAAPEGLAGWIQLPFQVDSYLKDRFGLRHAMIKLHNDLTGPVLTRRPLDAFGPKLREETRPA
jgi:hypothetical protein